ncbi:unc-93 homolog A [Pelobates cultripes]|uniref:Unc-93 homolog A n=1 Tax=Pelobates cultripes TaxID=61616 RepID=A0AAD1RF57_PELCU|nr:unc-93 homolog A [Pelobates cultripes]
MGLEHLKNIIILSIGFLLLATAYGGLQTLQSSLNPEKGLGVASLSVVYGCLICSSLLLPRILIKKIGCKWTIVASMCCYITYSRCGPGSSPTSGNPHSPQLSPWRTQAWHFHKAEGQEEQERLAAYACGKASLQSPNMEKCSQMGTSVTSPTCTRLKHTDSPALSSITKTQPANSEKNMYQ